MTTETPVESVWTAWKVAPESGFEVAGEIGEIGLIQRSASRFAVSGRFRFDNSVVQRDIVEKLRRRIDSDAEAREMFERARSFSPTVDGETDLASVPKFMRWFENTYGIHTLAAILHDELIVDAPNRGHLGSDTLSDRFFRLMLHASGVPWLKRWLIWAAVALRSRWAADGLRRFSVVLWVLAAVAGIGCLVVAVARAIDDGVGSTAAQVLFGIALLLPFAAAPLWGRQWGASVIAALSGVFVIPAALFAIVGQGVYWCIEQVAEIISRIRSS